MKKQKKLHVKLPRIGRAVNDKLKFGLLMDSVQPHLKEMLNTLDGMHRQKLARKQSSQGKGYRRYFYPIADGEGLHFELDPFRPADKRYGVKVELTPSRFGKRARLEIRSVLKEVLGTRADIFLAEAEILVTDTACDYPIAIGDVAIEVMNKKSAATYGKIYDGKTQLESIYCGSLNNSPHHVLAYDKISQLLSELTYAGKKKHQKLTKLIAKLDSDGPRMRLEEHREFPEGLPLWRLDEYPVPFKGVHIYQFAGAENFMRTPLQRQTLELAKYAGLTVAMHGLGKNEAATMRRRLSKCQVDWWDPAKFVEAVRKGLVRTGIFPAEAFKKRRA